MPSTSTKSTQQASHCRLPCDLCLGMSWPWISKFHVENSRCTLRSRLGETGVNARMNDLEKKKIKLGRYNYFTSGRARQQSTNIFMKNPIGMKKEFISWLSIVASRSFNQFVSCLHSRTNNAIYNLENINVLKLEDFKF